MPAAPPADPAAQLATQAGDRLQQLVASLLQQYQVAGDGAAALTQRILAQQAASLATVTAANNNVFALPNPPRRVVLRDIPKLGDLEPLTKPPQTFSAAIGSVNAWLHDPLLAPEPTPAEIARELVEDFRVADALPNFTLPPPTAPDYHDPAPRRQ